MAGLTEATIRKLKVNELKAELSKRGLVVKGKKDDLVNRLLEALEGEDEIEEDVESVGEGGEMEPTEESMEGDDEQEAVVGTSAVEEEDLTEPSGERAEEPLPEEESKAPDSSCDIEGEGSAEVAEETEDYVVVSKPSEEEAEEVEKSAEAQDAVVDEQEVTEGQGQVEEKMEEGGEAATVEETPMEETSTEVSQSSKEESPKKKDVSSTEEGEKKGSDEAKNGEKETAKKDGEKEKKKEPEIPDVMSAVEEEEGEIPEEFEIPEGHVAFDPYLCDFNFVISNNGSTAHTLTKNGFQFMWAGGKANKGAKGGKIGYELKVMEVIPSDIPGNESPVNSVRVGWSSEFSNLMLGESSLSYGFESTGKVCASSSFFEYGESFAEGDVIGTYLDLESEPKTLRYTKNGEDLGVAMSLTVNLDEKPLFPHVYLRNMKVEMNFGGNEEPWFPVLEGYSFLQSAEMENVADRVGKVPAEFSDCEVIMMVGLPSSGKTTWAKKHVESHQKRHYNIIGLKQVMDRCKLEGHSRKKSDPNAEKLNKAAITVLTKLYQLCPKRKRNYIFDQNNVYKIAQEQKMAAFAGGFKRKAVLVVPMHDSLRRRTSDAKRRGEVLVDIPFGDFCDMKCEFHIPKEGEFFDEIVHSEMDEKNTEKTVRDYHSDGSRAKRLGRDDHSSGSKRKRYDDQRSSYDKNRDRSGGRSDGWKGSGSGYGGYDKGRYNQGGYGSQGSYGGSQGGYKQYNKPSNDPYRRNNSGGSGGGGGYRQQSSYGGNQGGGYRGNNNYNQSYGSNNYNQSQGSWGNNQYSQGQSQNQQQWGQWGNYNNSYNSNSSNNSNNYRGGGGYSY